MCSSQHTVAIQEAAWLKRHCVWASATSWPSTSSFIQIVLVSTSFIREVSYKRSRKSRKEGSKGRARLRARGHSSPCMHACRGLLATYDERINAHAASH